MKLDCQHRHVSGGECLECQLHAARQVLSATQHNSMSLLRERDRLHEQLRRALFLLRLYVDNQGSPDGAARMLLRELDNSVP